MQSFVEHKFKILGIVYDIPTDSGNHFEILLLSQFLELPAILHKQPTVKAKLNLNLM